jgi:hypothetical protein
MDLNIAGILSDIGFDYRYLTAGFCGGFVNMAYFRKSKPKNVLGLILAGGLTANYLHPMTMHFLGTTAITASFITGMAGNAFCHGLMEAVKMWASPKGLVK